MPEVKKGKLEQHLVVVSIVFLITSFYLLSYAPYVRFCKCMDIEDYTLAFFYPVEFLIDETCFGELYLPWVEYCGVLDEVLEPSYFRRALRQIEFPSDDRPLPSLPPLPSLEPTVP